MKLYTEKRFSFNYSSVRASRTARDVGVDIESRKIRQRRIGRKQARVARSDIHRLQFGERMRALDVEGSGRRAAKRGEMRTSAERGRDVLREHTDVHALAARDAHDRVRRRPADELERDDLDLARSARNFD